MLKEAKVVFSDIRNKRMVDRWFWEVHGRIG